MRVKRCNNVCMYVCMLNLQESKEMQESMYGTGKFSEVPHLYSATCKRVKRCNNVCMYVCMLNLQESKEMQESMYGTGKFSEVPHLYSATCNYT